MQIVLNLPSKMQLELSVFPIQVFTIPVQTPMQAIDALRNGVPMGNTLHDVMYLFGEKHNTMTGILCSSDSIEQRGEKYYLKK